MIFLKKIMRCVIQNARTDRILSEVVVDSEKRLELLSPFMKAIPLLIAFVMVTTHFPLVFADQKGRYFYEGDGHIIFLNRHSGKKVSVTYRHQDGSYPQSAINQLNSVFGMPAEAVGEDISLRLVSLIDSLEDIYSRNKTIQIDSGYRSPSANANLRTQGKTAGETSYHMEGMAADVVFPGASPEKIWEHVKSLNCCGVGYYNGKNVHIDSGKPRFWTKETALPKTKEPPENRNIYLSIDKDIYFAGETMRLFLSGISQYPFGLRPSFRLKNNSKTLFTFVPEFYQKKDNNCIVVKNRKEGRLIYWTIPDDFKGSSDKLSVELNFCEPITTKMPANLVSRPFVIEKKD